MPLDIDAMRKCAALIEGEHDFKSFEASGSKVKSTVRTVYRAEVAAEGDIRGGVLAEGRVYITVTGNGFLYNMVRIIAGTLVYAGMGKLAEADIARALEEGDRTLAGKTLPPEGLTLMSVEYGDDADGAL